MPLLKIKLPHVRRTAYAVYHLPRAYLPGLQMDTSRSQHFMRLRRGRLVCTHWANNVRTIGYYFLLACMQHFMFCVIYEDEARCF